MDTVILASLGVLAALAALDLWVGVTNDAVNFLNSAIGSRVASRRSILLLAALGVFFGATFSTGMMEIARRGVFDPRVFTAPDGSVAVVAILAVYLGVMASDVIMLDLFNSFGLPTSTTVSIISELVGASVAVSFWLGGGDLRRALATINSGPVLGIYSGIFLSVVVAFTSGVVVMFLARLAFTHDVERRFRIWGWLWSAVSFSSLGYFVLLKGLRNAAFLDEETRTLLLAHSWAVAAGIAALAALLGLVLARRPRVVLTAIILAGTCALAIAFAGNDLVNFIGPTVAAFQAALISGVDLGGAIATPSWALAVAGAIMVTSLWLSVKARTVTDTEVRLAAQGDVEQRFPSTALSRFLVRSALGAGSVWESVVPDRLRRWGHARLERPPQRPGDPPYDLLRASVNLTVAAILISLGTANRLPLSTTYITFMVAMGASLADGTWGRASAESRVSGVLAVLGGWVVTGFLAAAGAFIMASAIYLLSTAGAWGQAGSLVMVGLAVAVSLWKLGSLHDARTRDRSTLS